MTDFDSIDYFTDPTLVPDPYPYFDHLRARCPVQRIDRSGVVAVTGYAEALAVYRDSDAFSSCTSVIGPLAGLPFEPSGDDIGALIEAHRDQIPLSEHMVTFDPPQHTQARALLNRLITPRRLKENEEFMWRLADRQLDEFIDKGACEFLGDYAKPFATLVIADLLGVPEEDHKAFRSHLAAQRVGAIEDDPKFSHNPLEFLENWFTSYIQERRREARGDVLTLLAEAKYPDGSTPEVIDVVRLATFLFAAGQETTTKLLSAALRIIAERPDLQQLLRDDPSAIAVFVEETLRMESPVKSDFRLVRTTSTIGNVDVSAGTTVMILPGAANRDPRKFDEPNDFRIDRRNAREQIAFGRGIHSCPGAPLARAEGRISVESFLARTADIQISQTEHGPANARRYTYEPTYQLRGLTHLHLEFTPVATGANRQEKEASDG
jgi:cytochrome P450